MPTTRTETLLVDTNILLEATDEKRRHHAAARELVENHAALVLSAQVVREYLVVATRPATSVNGLGLSLADATSNVRAFRERIRLLPEEKPTLHALLDLLASVPCTGRRIHDAHLVATALVHRVKRIVTLNDADFRPFAEQVATLDPRAALA